MERTLARLAATSSERTEIFAGLHRPGDPLLLPNAQAAYAVAARAAAEMLASGTYDTSAGGIPYDEMNAALRAIR
jgi:hypothetical protein